MRTYKERKQGNIMLIDLIDEYILGVNQNLNNKGVECDFLDEESVYVNLKRFSKFNFRLSEEEKLYWIAHHVRDILNLMKDENSTWVLYTEPNYWKRCKDCGSVEIDEIEEADVIQYMIYKEEI